MPDPRRKTLTIVTPEGVRFPLTIASPVLRFIALLIDVAAIHVLTSLVGTILRLFSLIGDDLAIGLSMFSIFALSILYPIVSEWYWKGQTLGKKLLHLRVMDSHGLRLRLSQVVIRNLMRFVDMVPVFYFTGAITAFINSKGQRLGDIVGNTIVVSEAVLPAPDLDHIVENKYNSLKTHPHLCARFRHSVNTDEAGLLLQALTRRDELGDDERLDLFAEMRDYFERKVRFPQDALDGLSDEQYIRNITEIVFERKV